VAAVPVPIRDNTALSRFELEDNGAVVFMTYRLRDAGVISLDHTETPVAARGRGLASKLIEAVLAEVRRRGLKIVVRCPFVTTYLEKHPEDRDLLA
jgi:predicted GNAT family acetyltransferase